MLVGNPRRTDHLEDLGVDNKYNYDIKMNLINRQQRSGVDSYGSGQI
jgi:hypothetical protein